MDTIEILGNLTKDPDVRATKTGGCMVRFSVGSNRKYQDRATGEMKEVASFIPCVVWNELAESAANYLKKESAYILKGVGKAESIKIKTGRINISRKLLLISLLYRFLSIIKSMGKDSRRNNSGTMVKTMDNSRAAHSGSSDRRNPKGTINHGIRMKISRSN